MSSPLAFDKQGNPLSFHKRTQLLRVRLFHSPSARGTCSKVLDADGNQLYIDKDTEYAVFRQLVGNVPGLYRLDQCDDDGTDVDDAPAAYINLAPARNAQATGGSETDVNALAVIREMAAGQREMAAIQGQALKALADNHALILASAAEVMRAPRPAPLPVDPRNAAREDESDGDDEYTDDDADESADENDDADNDEAEAMPGGFVGMLAQLAKTIDPKDARKFGEWMLKSFMQFRRETATDANAAPTSVAAPPASHTAAPVVAQSAPAPVATRTERVVPAPTVIAPEAVAREMTASETPVDTAAGGPAASEPIDATDADADAVGQMPHVTEDQVMHIAMINAQLTAEEQAIAGQVMARMDKATIQRWLEELSALSVEDAIPTVREAIAEYKQRRTRMTR